MINDNFKFKIKFKSENEILDFLYSSNLHLDLSRIIKINKEYEIRIYLDEFQNSIININLDNEENYIREEWE